MGTRTEQTGAALRRIPSLDAWLRRDVFGALSRPLVTRVSRRYLEEIRGRVLAGELDEADVAGLFDGEGAVDAVLRRCDRDGATHHARVINATGIVLHTGIGRAPMAEAARRAVSEAAGYSIVEVDPESGERNEREAAVAGLLRELLGVDGALVVNNNAACVTLSLAAVAAGGEAVISRGQLVEIGGGFRMPDVMAQAGCHMVEVGTTNRTHLRDFQSAITEATRCLLLVHPSNFRVEGFTGMPSRAELVALAREHEILVIDDLGSGLLVTEPLPGLEDEPTVAQAVADDADLTCFSGDKLLGGPQCGIVVGGAEVVARVRRHPLYRAFRCDKMILAALEATLRIYRDGDPLSEIPTLAALAAEPGWLRQRAETLAAQLASLGTSVVASDSFAGSGANPARPLPSFAVALSGGDATAAALRAPGAQPAVFARIANDAVLLDQRSLVGENLDDVARAVLARLGPDAATPETSS